VTADAAPRDGSAGAEDERRRIHSGDAYDIAGLCAHPDDAELVMGGTLAREAARGRRVALVDLTRGEAGSRGTPETRATEAAEAARLLGVAHREALGLPDGGLTNVTEQKDPIVEALRRLRPQIVILPQPEQRHPDHRTASQLIYDACFLAGLKNYRPTLGTAFRPRKLLYSLAVTDSHDTAPTFVVDITAFWATKMAAIAAFRSQFPPVQDGAASHPLDRFQAAVELHARRQGQRIGVAYGEGFVVKEPFSVDDLLALTVSSL
jgi:N-acetylglucosamine malate deacetylase 1